MNVVHAPFSEQTNTRDYDALVQDTRVHGSIYSDPAIFEEEMTRIFHRTWVFVGHESEVPNPGDFRSRPIGRQPVIMVRGDDGKVRVLMNRCTHRAAVVCPHERGNAAGFTCAYHGWSFRNTGELRAVPSPQRYNDSFKLADYGLRPAPRVDSYRGMVFASLHPDVPTLDEHLGPLVKDQIDMACDMSPQGEFVIETGTHKYGYAGNWKLQVENAVDAYHLSYLHRGFLQLVKEKTGVDPNITSLPSSPARSRHFGNGHVSWDMAPSNKERGQVIGIFGNRKGQQPYHTKYVEDLVAAHGQERTERLLNTGTAHCLIFPNVVVIAAQLRVIRPVSVDKTEVFLYTTTLKGVPPEINQQRLAAHESFYGPAGGGATDDLEVFERIQMGLHANVDPWVDLSRGAGQERKADDGGIDGHISDELSSRSILHRWRDLMSGTAYQR